MTRFARTRLITVAFGLSLASLAAPASAEKSYTLTGPHGVTTTGVVDCSKADAAVTCERDATAVLPGGAELDRHGERILTRDGSTLTLTTTTEGGRVFTTTRDRRREH